MPKKKKQIQIMLGQFVIVKNKNAHAADNSNYMFGIVREGTKEVPLMPTMSEYSKAVTRAGKNPEDCVMRHTVVRPKKRGFMAWLRGN